MSHEDTAGKQFIGETMQPLNLAHNVTIHVDNRCHNVRGLKYGIAVPALIMIVYLNIGWINGWKTNVFLLYFE